MSRILFFIFIFLAFPALAAYQPPPGTNGQLPYNKAGQWGAYTISGDCTLVVGTGIITCTKTGGNAFAASATTDTTTTANITDSTNKRFVTDAQLVVIGNTSGTNTGDQVVPANTTGTSHNWFSAYNSTTGAFTKSQPACGDLSDSGTACADNTGTSGSTIPLNNGNNTTSGNNTYSGTTAITTTSLPAQAAGSLALAGTATKPTLGANSEGDIFLTATGGLNIIGQGSSNDFTIFNKSGTSTCVVATGTTTLNCVGLQINGVAASTTTGTVTSVTFTGDGTVLSSTPSSAVTTSGTVTAALANAASGTVLGNATGSSAAPTYTAAPVLGKSGTIGTLTLTGNTSGTVLLTPQAAAGTPTVTFGTSSGTPAVTASSPLAITTATGNITCTTCATTTNGGALTATSPMAISAGGVISINAAIGGTYLGDAVTGNQTIVLVQYAPYAFTINTLKNLGTVSGTVTGALKINGTNVTGCNALSLTSTPAASTSCSGANVVAAGDLITFVTTSASSLTGLLAFSMIGTRG